MGIAVLVGLLGFAMTLAGVFLFIPGTPVVPVLSAGDPPGLIVMALGASWSALGTFQYLRHAQGWFGKAFMAALCVLCVAGAAANAWWVLDVSYKIPAPVEIAEKPIPAFELTDQNGKKVSDTGLRGKPVVLIFARGVW